MEGVTLIDVFKQIEAQSEFVFIYKNETINLDKKVDVKVEGATVDKILENVLQNSGVKFEINNKQIIVTPNREIPSIKNEKILKEETQQQQKREIYGMVKDNRGLSLPGVSVVVKGTTSGITTDSNGKFTLAIPTEAKAIIFSFVGMKAQEFAITGKISFNVVMEEETVGLEEVVAIGYGTQKKESVTAAVGSVKGKELMTSPSANVSNMLAGRITGITSIQDVGSPGNDQSRIYIRGLGTTGNSNPLYVIDGIPREPLDFQRLAPSEIDNISVLKDAAAAAVYGARGANGVILITTKRGSSQQASISYSVNYGLQKATRLPDYLDSYGYATLYNKALSNEGRSPFFTADDLAKYKDGSDPIFHPNTKWMNILSGTAPIQQHNLSISGGNERVKYFLSFNYLDQKSVVNNEANTNFGFTRYNFRSNIDAQITKTTKVSFDLSGYMGKTTQPSGGYYFSELYRDPPIYAGKYPNGMWGPGYSNRNDWARTSESGYNNSLNDGLLTRLELLQDITFIKGLSLKGMVAFDYKPDKNKTWSLPVKAYNAVQDGSEVRYDQISGFGKPSLSQNMGLGKNLVIEAHAIYNRSFIKHNISGLLLYSQQSQSYENLGASRVNYLSDQLDIIDAGSTINKDNSGSANQYHRQSVVSRLSYNYDLRYLLEFSFRYDGSDLFAQGKQFGFFPSVSAGWVISKEKFMQNLTFIDNLKLRGSHGTLGNDQIGQYQYLAFYNYGSGVPMGSGSSYQDNVYLNRLPNTVVTWEKSKKTDVGFESVFSKYFTLEADLFWEKRNDILGKRSATIPDYLGISSSQLPFENFQRVNNHGFELVIGYNKHFYNGVGIQARFNYTHAVNTVIDIGEPSDKPARIRQEGRPLNSQYGYEALGLFQSAEEVTAAYGSNYPNVKPGDIHYADLNGDKKIDGNDITYIGSNNLPTNIFGFNSNINYKGFEFSMFWQAGTGNQQYLSNWLAIPFEQAGSALKVHLDNWSPDNPNAKYPRILTTSAWNNGSQSSFWLYDMKYLRLKNIEIAYSLPKRITDRIYLQNVRLFANAVNLLTISPYKEVDPENTSGTIYPQQKIYNFGAQISF